LGRGRDNDRYPQRHKLTSRPWPTTELEVFVFQAGDYGKTQRPAVHGTPSQQKTGEAVGNSHWLPYGWQQAPCRHAPPKQQSSSNWHAPPDGAHSGA
jgi:hypothetical protein